MAMVSGQRSALNPNAPAFVPAMYQRVEDFSPEWWELVKSSTWFRDYWLSLNPEGSFDDEIIEDLLPEEIDLAADMTGTVAGDVKLGAESEKSNALNGLIVDAKTLLRDLNQSPTRSPKEKSPRSGVEPAKFQMRPVPHRVGSPRPGGRRIQQPR